MKTTLLTAAAASVGIFASSAFAHQTFLLPEQFIWQMDQPVDISLTSALSFPDLAHGPAQDRIALAEIVTGGVPVDDVSYSETETVLGVQFSPAAPGFARVAVSFKSRSGPIAPEDADGYFDEIGASSKVRAAFEALPGSPPLQRSYSKHAKTFLCIETCMSGNNAATEPVGQALEFVAVGAGNRTYRLLRHGEVLASHSVDIVPASGDAIERITSADGTINIPDTVTGAIMLTSVVISLPETPDGVYHSDYATLTLDLTTLP